MKLKQQFGKWAYVFSTLKALQETPVADYTITLDERETIRDRGVACVIANAGAIGVGTLRLSPSIDIDDGKLDVILVRTAHIEGIFELTRMMMGIEGENPQDGEPGIDASHLVSRWQVSKVSIESDPIQDIQVDGDLTEVHTPQLFEVLPASLELVV